MHMLPEQTPTRNPLFWHSIWHAMLLTQPNCSTGACSANESKTVLIIFYENSSSRVCVLCFVNFDSYRLKLYRIAPIPMAPAMLSTEQSSKQRKLRILWNSFLVTVVIDPLVLCKSWRLYNGLFRNFHSIYRWKLQRLNQNRLTVRAYLDITTSKQWISQKSTSIKVPILFC